MTIPWIKTSNNIGALDSMFEDVHAFERDVLNKWNDVQ